MITLPNEVVIFLIAAGAVLVSLAVIITVISASHSNIERPNAQHLEILDKYMNVLKEHGPDSRQEKEFRKQYESDKKLFPLLNTARLISKGLLQSKKTT